MLHVDQALNYSNNMKHRITDTSISATDWKKSKIVDCIYKELNLKLI